MYSEFSGIVHNGERYCESDGKNVCQEQAGYHAPHYGRYAKAFSKFSKRANRYSSICFLSVKVQLASVVLSLMKQLVP